MGSSINVAQKRDKTGASQKASPLHRRTSSIERRSNMFGGTNVSDAIGGGPFRRPSRFRFPFNRIFVATCRFLSPGRREFPQIGGRLLFDSKMVPTQSNLSRIGQLAIGFCDASWLNKMLADYGDGVGTKSTKHQESCFV